MMANSNTHASGYDLSPDCLTKRIYEIVKRIPTGRVATYGQVAEIAGNKNLARVVGNVLHKNPDPGHIPCFRVVNSKGRLATNFAFGEGVQERLLREEGIEVRDGKVDLAVYGISDLTVLK